jgi:hypothetical protein
MFTSLTAFLLLSKLEIAGIGFGVRALVLCRLA